MAIVKRICKICGNEYEYCHTTRSAGVFRWQDVACSPEHASEYLAKIRASRGQASSVNHEDSSNSVDKDIANTIGVIEPEVILDDDMVEDEEAED